MKPATKKRLNRVVSIHKMAVKTIFLLQASMLIHFFGGSIILDKGGHGWALGIGKQKQVAHNCNRWLFLVPVKGGRWHIIYQLAVYTTYIPLIYCLLGGYMLPTTLYRNLKNPLMQSPTKDCGRSRYSKSSMRSTRAMPIR